MNFLFLHQNMPGQFKHLATHFAANPNHKVVFGTKREGIELPNIRKLQYKPHRDPPQGIHHYTVPFEQAVLFGQAALRACQALPKEGFIPDIIIAHPGWGESLFMKDLFPHTPLLHYCEFYYHGRGADALFDPTEPPTLDGICRLRARNALHLLSLEACDHGYSPTLWQQSQFPASLRSKIDIIFDGIDTNIVRPNPNATFTLPDGRVLTTGHEVITYVSRNLEPYRGFPSFIRSLPDLLRRRPNADVIVVGGDDTSYGAKPTDGRCWREVMMEEVDFDRSRVHFMGKIPYNRYLALLQISSLHIYLTRPFVLSWSAVEAMSAGCLILGSNTPPVQEFIDHGLNGVLTDFFDPAAIADQAVEMLANPQRYAPMRAAARATVEARCSLRVNLPRQIALIERLVGRPT